MESTFYKKHFSIFKKTPISVLIQKKMLTLQINYHYTDTIINYFFHIWLM